MAKAREKERISRSFKRDFPEFVERAEALGVRIKLVASRKRGVRRDVYWLDGYRQLTGYDTNKDGSPFARSDAARHIDRVLTDMAEDLAAAAAMTEDERFARVMAKTRQIKPQYRMLGECRFPNGDGAGIFFMSSFDGTVRLAGIGDVATAKVAWDVSVPDAERMAMLCDFLEQDYEARKVKRAQDAKDHADA